MNNDFGAMGLGGPSNDPPKAEVNTGNDMGFDFGDDNGADPGASSGKLNVCAEFVTRYRGSLAP